MTDVIDQETTEDVGPSQEVDTSTNEETQDTDSSDDLENDDTSFDLDDETEETEESNDETEDEAATESEDEEEEESEEDVEEADSEEDSTPQEDDQKKRNDEMAKRRIAEREAREADKQKQYDEYLNEAEDDTDRALREVRLEAYVARIERNNDKINTGLDKAVAAIPELTKGTPEFKEALNEAYQDFLDTKVVWDRNGDPIDIKGDVLDYLKAKADSYRKIAQSGARTQKKQKAAQKSRTDVVPTRPPKQSKSDPLLDGFDEEVAKNW